MKKQVSPVVAAVVVIVVLVIAAWFGWKKAGPAQAYTKPINMGEMMAKSRANPYQGSQPKPAAPAPNSGR